MKALSFPKYNFKIKDEDNKTLIFDEFRKKWIVLTPEENVRQHLCRYLNKELDYPKGLISIEKQITVNSLTKRFDIVVYNNDGKPSLLVECKAPNIKLDTETLNQVLRYNIALKCNIILFTNGIDIHCCKVNFNDATISFLKNIPNFITL